METGQEIVEGKLAEHQKYRSDMGECQLSAFTSKKDEKIVK
jgi:hypothetical protein